MKKVFCFILSIALLFALSATMFASADDLAFSDDPKAIQAASNSVIMLSCYDKDGNLYATGSAFAAFEEGVFVTNCHVIKDEVYSIKAQMESGLEFAISSVVAYDDERDLAILRTEAKTGLEPLPLGSSADLERGEKVIAIGSPLGLINTLSIGLYSGTLKDEQTFLQFSAAISHGSSGGALFNNQGEVIGITSASFTEGQNLNLAIPIEDAVELWEKREDSSELSIPEFYDLSDHIKSYSVSYILSHKSEFSRGMIIKTEGFVYVDPYSERRHQYYLLETLSDYSAICNAQEVLKALGGPLSDYDYYSVKRSVEGEPPIVDTNSGLVKYLEEQYGKAEPNGNNIKQYEAQTNYEDLLEKNAFLVSGYKQNGTADEGDYILIQGEISIPESIPRLKNVSIINTK